MEKEKRAPIGADPYHLTIWGNGIVDKPVISSLQTHRGAAAPHITGPLSPLT